MSKATEPMAMSNSHTTSISDLDLDGVPASHRHGIRTLRARLNDCDISIDHVKSNSDDTTVFLSVGNSGLMSLFGVRAAFSGTGVERVNVQFGELHCIVIDGPLGFEV